MIFTGDFNLLFLPSLILFLLFSTFFAEPPDKLAEALIFACGLNNGFQGMGMYFSGKKDISLQYSDSLNTSMNSPVISSYPGRPVSAPQDAEEKNENFISGGSE